MGMLCGGLSGQDAECYYNLFDGIYSFNYWAHSSYGDTSTQGSAAMNVDGTQPILVDLFTPGTAGLRGWYQAGPVTLTCTASDATSLMDTLVFTGGTPIAGGVAKNTEGPDTLTCTATDMAGNTAVASHPANIDSVPPTLEVLYNGDPDPGGWSGASVHVTATASDATSGIYSFGFSVNGGPLETDRFLGDGYYEIAGYAEDVAGNVTTTTAIVGVDTTAPTTSWSTDSNGWVRGTVTLSGTSEDAGSGVAAVYISFDGKDWIRVGSDPNWSYVWNTLDFSDGQYLIEARAVDMAGNEEHTAMLVIGVDNTKPNVDMDPEWTIPSSGGAGGSDNLSGVARARVTISGNGIAPWTRDYGSVPGSIEWDGRDGNGNLGGYGDYEVTLEVWDKAGNYNVTHGIIHRVAPPTAVPQPTQVVVVPVAPTQAPTIVPEVEPITPKVELPRGLPFWSIVLPLGALGVWLAASNIALARDRRWSELRGIRQAVARYRDQNKINFPKEGEHD